MVSVERIMEALENVHDPHLPISIVRLGMVDTVETSAGHADIGLRMPCLSCPGVTVLQSRIEDELLRIDGIRTVKVSFGWGKLWDATLVDPEAQSLMKEHGLLL
jgi:metal-sulfur cluster biosynthetic enzyme